MRKACVLAEHRAHDAVDLLRARQVVAERLLEHDAHLRAVQAGARRAARRSREQVGLVARYSTTDVGVARRVEPVASGRA